jgi:protein gp37
MNKTTIEWTDYTWNPVTGCDKVSAGCRSCYAETLANRFWGDRKFTDVQMHEDRLHEPEQNQNKWRGKKVFVCSMSDLFHEDVTFEFITKVFHLFYYLPDTIFQIPTKRPARALEFFKYAAPIFFDEEVKRITTYRPLKNVWIGTSCENQATANERIPLLLQIPAAVRFLSCEPLLGPIDLWHFSGNTIFPIDWVICGGESGHHARPMHPDWVRSLRDQCTAAGVPFFIKQWGEWVPDSHVSFNGPFFIHDHVHYLINDDGRGKYYESFDHTVLKKRLPENGEDLTKKSNAWWMAKTGKSKSGNMLDGKQHLEFPNQNI